MNRIVKYRAWDKKNKEMLYTYNDWEDDSKKVTFNRIYAPTFGSHILEISYSEDLTLYDISIEVIESCVAMQFTGLYDKNGKEIYESDIVKYKTQYGSDESPSSWGPEVVKYINGEFLPRERSYDCEDSYYSYRDFDFEIIGNLFETPELLNK
jgi:uncharacterized phage protein (TIGR01671 family)